ncbi:hypothetical protein D3C72_1750200 [compost metagenome]
MAVVRVLMAKKWTVAKSASVSIATSDAPTMMAGRARGRLRRRKLCQGVQPSNRLEWIRLTDCSRKEARASR